eukprot:jgi/Botrbrau1/17198/Bobra.126_1s0003.1
MVRLTLIARVTDGLPLAEGLDSDKSHNLDEYKQKAKQLFKKMSLDGPQASRMSVDLGAPYMFHYIVEGGICYLTLTDKGYPKKLAYEYLEELQKEFSKLYGAQVDTAARPYAFIKFDTFIQKTKKLFVDTRTQRNLTLLQEDLSDIHNIMTRNIAEVLEQGERLDRMQQNTSMLASESKAYATRAKALHSQALLRKYGPILIIVGAFMLLFWLRKVVWG